MLTNLRDYFAIKHSGLFDEKYYLLHNPDVRRADIDPLKHFIKYGWKEGRNPSQNFETKYYLEMYPDVQEAGVNPLIHYLRHGKKEGRFSSFEKERQNINLGKEVEKRNVILT